MSTRRLALFLAASLCLPGAGPTLAQTRPLTIFAAASLREALDEIARAFVATGQARPVLSYAGSNQLAQQIEQGAPADVFVSADTNWMDELATRGLLRAGTRRDLLGNSLVLIGAAGSRPVTIDRTLDLAGLLKGGRLATPDLVAVPAGKYAKASLEALGLFAQVKNHLAPAENVRVALAYVARGEAPLGIVYATDAAAQPKVAVLGTFPKDSHPPITYPVAGLSASANPQMQAFLAFLDSAEARRIFEARGFTVLR